MSLLAFAEAYERLTLQERATFEKGVQHLLAEGSLWREEDHDQTLYVFLSAHIDMVSVFLLTVGWELHVHERYKVLYITHRDGRNRYHFTAGQTRLLLLLRLLYSQSQEQATGQRWHPQMSYTRVTSNAVSQHYYSLYGKHLSRTAFKEWLQLFARFKLIRVHWGNQQHTIQQAQIELVPLLEVLLPSERFTSLLEQWTHVPEEAGGEGEPEIELEAQNSEGNEDENDHLSQRF